MIDYAREVSEILEQQLGIGVPSRDTDLIAAGLLDSLAFVELLAGLEQRFGVRVDLLALEVDELRTVEKIGRFVARQVPPA